MNINDDLAKNDENKKIVLGEKDIRNLKGIIKIFIQKWSGHNDYGQINKIKHKP